MNAVAPLRFLGVGALNTVAGLAVIYLGKGLFQLDDVTSNALGYAFGMAMSFILNRRWTFAHTGAPGPALIRFLTVIVIAYAANLAAVLVAIDSGIHSYAAQALGIPIYTAIAYWGSRRYAFLEVASR